MITLPFEICLYILELRTASCTSHEQRNQSLLFACTISKVWVEPARRLLFQDVRLSCLVSKARAKYECQIAYPSINRNWRWWKVANAFNKSKSQLAKLDAFLAVRPAYTQYIKRLEISSGEGSAMNEVWSISEWRDRLGAYSKTDDYHYHDRITKAEQLRIERLGPDPLPRALKQLATNLSPNAEIALHIDASSIQEFVQAFAANLVSVTVDGHAPEEDPFLYSSILFGFDSCVQLHTLRLKVCDFGRHDRLGDFYQPFRCLPSTLKTLELESCRYVSPEGLASCMRETSWLPLLERFSVEMFMEDDGALGWTDEAISRLRGASKARGVKVRILKRRYR